MRLDTIRHFPEHLGRMWEYRIIAEIYDRRLSMVLEDLVTVMNNQYLSTMDGDGCRRREEILGIVCNPTDTLDERIRRIKGYYSSNRPYTVKKVKEILCSMCGEGNYTLRIDRSVRDIRVGIALNTVNMVDHVREIMGHIRPANMTLAVMVLYNDHRDLAYESHGALAAYTHGGLRTDPALDRTDYGEGA